MDTNLESEIPNKSPIEKGKEFTFFANPDSVGKSTIIETAPFKKGKKVVGVLTGIANSNITGDREIFGVSFELETEMAPFKYPNTSKQGTPGGEDLVMTAKVGKEIYLTQGRNEKVNGRRVAYFDNWKKIKNINKFENEINVFIHRIGQPLTIDSNTLKRVKFTVGSI
ncbi:MAG TPA: hypothetical protein VIK81_03600 [Patescibacteria group bacterium]